ncbi:MAG: SGNH/GDSL hydrolase family protein [Desulfuromonadales bacterium]
MTQAKKYKILLVGDSVFDNVSYVDDGKDTVNAIRREFSSIATVDSVAVDGYTTIEVLFQLVEGVLKVKPKYDYIFLSIGGNDLLVDQEVYLDPSIGPEGKLDFLDKVGKRFNTIYKLLREISDHVYWLGVYTPHFNLNMFDEDYICLAKQAIQDVNRRFKLGVSPKYMLSTSSILNKPEDFTQVIEPSAVGSEKLAKELKRVIYESMGDA